MIVPAALYVLLLRGRRLVRLAALTGCFLLPVAGYLGWFDAAHGQWNFTTFDGAFLYGRVADFADCKGLNLPAYERPLCPAEPPAQRVADFYTWNPQSPQWTFTPPAGRSRDAVVRDFSLRILRHQPGAYAEAVLRTSATGSRRSAGPGRNGTRRPTWSSRRRSGPTGGVRLDRGARLPGPGDTGRARRLPQLRTGGGSTCRARCSRPGCCSPWPDSSSAGATSGTAAVHGQRGGRPAAPGPVRHVRLAVPACRSSASSRWPRSSALT